MVRSFRFPRYVRSELPGSGRGEEPSGGNALHLIQDRLSDAEFCEHRTNLSNQFAATANHRFECHKRSQLLIRTHHEPLSVAAMRVNNPDCLSPTIIKEDEWSEWDEQHRR